jgi:glutamate/tyrosine decarboxylase-like PLP-dependent enzyme
MNTTMNPAQLIAREIETFPNEVRELRVAPTVSSSEIRRRLERYTFAEEVPLADALSDVAGMLRQWTLHAQHPRYFGLFVPGVHEAGVWADALAALYNPQVGAWWHAPAANEIETHTLNFLAAVIGYDAKVAQFTTGGSEANLTALLAAIASAYPSSVEQGVGAAASNGTVYVSSQAHHSIHKAVRIAGLGTAVLRTVPCNERLEMDVESLRRLVASDVKRGFRPIMIVGTAGTTTAGAIDDLEIIGEIAREHSAWFHADAAWAGAAGFSPRLRSLLHGIELADSVTWDAHKWLSVPMGAGMFFCRRADVLHSLFGVDAAYVPKKTDEGDDLYLTSLQWSRRFIGLKVFITLATQSREGVGARIDRQVDVAEYLRRRLTDSGWLVVNDTALPLVCFTHPKLADRAAVDAVAQHVVSGGRAWISAASLPAGRVLRACITHDDCASGDVDVLHGELQGALAAVAG